MEEFNNININLGGITWDQFGNAREVDIDDLLNTLNIHGPERIVVVDLWKRHPNRTQQGKYILFLLLHLILNFV
jgi:hypothetical protein